MTTPPRLAVEQISARRWRLLEPLTWREWTVPAGFVTDFASSPRWAWPIVPQTGRHAWACVLHDWWYQGGDQGKSREQADVAFLVALLEAGVTPEKAVLMYRCVRISNDARNQWRRHHVD